MSEKFIASIGNRTLAAESHPFTVLTDLHSIPARTGSVRKPQKAFNQYSWSAGRDSMRWPPKCEFRLFQLRLPPVDATIETWPWCVGFLSKGLQRNMRRFITGPDVVLLHCPSISFLSFLANLKLPYFSFYCGVAHYIVLIRWLTYEITFYGTERTSYTFANILDVLQVMIQLTKITKTWIFNNISESIWCYISQ
jgi:hypothetical protein